MEWMPFALAAYAIWSSCNLLTKVLVSRYVKSLTVNLVVIGIWNLLPLLLIPVRGLTLPNSGLVILSLVSGILYLGILIPYFKALAIEEASRVVPLWRFTPLFILLFSSGLTGEKLNFHQIAAFLLLVIGGFLVSVKNLSDLFHPSRAFYLMILASFLSGVYTSIAKLIYIHIDYYDGFTLMRAGQALSMLGLLLIHRNRVEVVQTLRHMKAKVRGMLVLNGALEFGGLAFYNFAMSLAPASLLSASAGIQAIFVLLLSLLLSLKFPQLLHEDTSHRVLTQKGFAIVLIVIGTGMIASP